MTPTSDVHSAARRTRLAPVVASVLGVVALAMSLAAFHLANDQAVQVATQQLRQEQLALLDARVDVERLALDEITTRLLADAGETAMVVGSDAVSVGHDLAALAATGGHVAAHAAQLADALGSQEVGERDLIELVSLATTARALDARSTGDPTIDELRAAADRVTLPTRLAHGVVAASLLDARPDADVDSTTGWSTVLEDALAAPLEATARDAVEATNLLVEMDARLAASGQPKIHADLTRGLGAAGAGAADSAGTVAAAEELGADLGSAWTGAVASERRQVAEELDQAERSLERLELVAWVLAVLGGTVLVVGVVAAARRTADRVTAAPDRYDGTTGLLDGDGFRERAVRHVTDLRFGHHLVGVVRIGRFEMIEAGYGRPACDRVEALVARRITSALSWLVAGRHDAEAVAAHVRPGEFVLSVHSSRPIDIDLVRRVLLLRSGTAVPLGGDHVPVSYGAGLLMETGITDLESAVEAARDAVIDGTVSGGSAPGPAAAPLDLLRTHDVPGTSWSVS